MYSFHYKNEEEELIKIKGDLTNILEPEFIHSNNIVLKPTNSKPPYPCILYYFIGNIETKPKLNNGELDEVGAVDYRELDEILKKAVTVIKHNKYYLRLQWVADDSCLFDSAGNAYKQLRLSYNRYTLEQVENIGGGLSETERVFYKTIDLIKHEIFYKPSYTILHCNNIFVIKQCVIQVRKLLALYYVKYINSTCLLQLRNLADAVIQQVQIYYLQIYLTTKNRSMNLKKELESITIVNNIQLTTPIECCILGNFGVSIIKKPILTANEIRVYSYGLANMLSKRDELYMYKPPEEDIDMYPSYPNQDLIMLCNLCEQTITPDIPPVALLTLTSASSLASLYMNIKGIKVLEIVVNQRDISSGIYERVVQNVFNLLYMKIKGNVYGRSITDSWIPIKRQTEILKVPRFRIVYDTKKITRVHPYNLNTNINALICRTFDMEGTTMKETIYKKIMDFEPTIKEYKLDKNYRTGFYLDHTYNGVSIREPILNGENMILMRCLSTSDIFKQSVEDFIEFIEFIGAAFKNGAGKFKRTLFTMLKLIFFDKNDKSRIHLKDTTKIIPLSGTTGIGKTWFAVFMRGLFGQNNSRDISTLNASKNEFNAELFHPLCTITEASEMRLIKSKQVQNFLKRIADPGTGIMNDKFEKKIELPNPVLVILITQNKPDFESIVGLQDVSITQEDVAALDRRFECALHINSIKISTEKKNKFYGHKGFQKRPVIDRLAKIQKLGSPDCLLFKLSFLQYLKSYKIPTQQLSYEDYVPVNENISTARALICDYFFRKEKISSPLECDNTLYILKDQLEGAFNACPYQIPLTHLKRKLFSNKKYSFFEVIQGVKKRKIYLIETDVRGEDTGDVHLDYDIDKFTETVFVEKVIDASRLLERMFLLLFRTIFKEINTVSIRFCDLICYYYFMIPGTLFFTSKSHLEKINEENRVATICGVPPENRVNNNLVDLFQPNSLLKLFVCEEGEETFYYFNFIKGTIIEQIKCNDSDFMYIVLTKLLFIEPSKTKKLMKIVVASSNISFELPDKQYKTKKNIRKKRKKTSLFKIVKKRKSKK